MTTPNEIKTLKENEIIVFGSNLNGNHAGGLAYQCANQWNAVDGIGEGITGQCYAFPTLDKKMKKVSEKSLIESKDKLYKYALENPTKTFYLTKVGCGIAGFKEDFMKEIFKGEKPDNIIMPAGWSIIKGYKAFDKGLLCRGMQYELGKWFEHTGKIKPCVSGLHFCKFLAEVYEYYPFGSTVCEVESDGEVIDIEKKSVTNRLRLVRILNAENEAKANTNNTSSGYFNSGYMNSGNSNSSNGNSGDWNSGNVNSGNGNSGNANSGNSNSGSWNSGNSNSGYMNSGNANSGNRNSGSWNSGDWNSGNRNSGFFNTNTLDTIFIFNKKYSRVKWDRISKPSCLYFDLTKWINFSNMTDEEKEQYPQAKITGGYLKNYSYKEAFSNSLKNSSKEELIQITKLPNFNYELFEEISGINLKELIK